MPHDMIDLMLGYRGCLDTMFYIVCWCEYSGLSMCDSQTLDVQRWMHVTHPSSQFSCERGTDGSFPKQGDPNVGLKLLQNIITFIAGISKMVPRILGNPQMSLDREQRDGRGSGTHQLKLAAPCSFVFASELLYCSACPED